MRDPSEALSLPRPFGPFVLLQRIAAGGMAEVYVAKTRGTSGFEKLVALKLIHPRLSRDAEFTQMLVEEAKLSVLLSHPNVAQTFDLACVDGTYCIVMEYIEGADCFRLLVRADKRGVKVPVELAAWVVAEACSGLDYAHRCHGPSGQHLGIVHRDVSPQNVVLSTSGEVKILDFGIAKAALRTRKTEAGVLKGKYHYMSPEQANGSDIDYRSDIFSAGVVLYELLVGEMLHQEENVATLLDDVRRAEITPPTAKRPDTPEALSQIVMKALCRDPGRRYRSAIEMSHALQGFVYAHNPSFTPRDSVRLLDEVFGEEVRTNAANLTEPELPRFRSAGGTQALPAMSRVEFDPDRVSSVIRDDVGQLAEAIVSGGRTSAPPPPFPRRETSVAAHHPLIGGTEEHAPTWVRPPREATPASPDGSWEQPTFVRTRVASESSARPGASAAVALPRLPAVDSIARSRRSPPPAPSRSRPSRRGLFVVTLLSLAVGVAATLAVMTGWAGC